MRSSTAILAGCLRQGAVCVAVAAVVLACVWGAAALALSRDVGPVRNAIAFAFQNGTLPQHRVSTPDRHIGAFTYNDCVILMMAVNTVQPLRQKILSPALIKKLSDPEETDACLMLRDFVVEGNTSDYSHWPYHRYIHAFVPVTAVAVSALGLETWRSILLGVNYACVAALGAAGAASWSRRRRAGLPANATDTAAIVTSLVFVSFYGMDFYSQNLSIGLAEPIVFAWIGLLAFGRPLAWRTRTLVLATSIAFALVTAFEFWTGQIPVAAAAGVGFLGLSMRSARETRLAVARTATMLAAAGTTIVAMLAIKIVVASIVFGDNVLGDMTGQLGSRVGDASFGIVGLVEHLAGRADHIGQGSLVLGLAAGLLATLAGIVGLARLWRPAGRTPVAPVARRQAAFVLVSGLMLVAWHLVFRNHSSIHSEFMVRTFAWVWSAGAILLALSWRSPRLHHDHVADDFAAVEQVERGIDLVQRTGA